MNRLSLEMRSRILLSLCEGMSIRATTRTTGAAKNTIVKLLADVGTACFEYHDEVMRDLRCRIIQCDEIWSFCYAKAKNVPSKKRGEFGVGDVWTWVALDAETKLVPWWTVGNRDADTARDFMCELASRLVYRVQLTTDGLAAYLKAVDEAFDGDIDYAMLVKMYGPGEGKTEAERKYSPGECNGSKKYRVQGNPDKSQVSTSYVERQNLTMRMCMRRFTRLTNAFSKKIENHMHALSLFYVYYNFVRVHKTLGTTPAIAAGVADHAWTMYEVAELGDSK